MTLLQGNTGKILQDTGLGKNFLDMTPKGQTTKTKIDKCDYVKLKCFCPAKVIIIRVEAIYRMGRNI
jgi:hypothetical protein